MGGQIETLHGGRSLLKGRKGGRGGRSRGAAGEGSSPTLFPAIRGARGSPVPATPAFLRAPRERAAASRRHGDRRRAKIGLDKKGGHREGYPWRRAAVTCEIDFSAT
jgi:hypothetical protein